MKPDTAAIQRLFDRCCERLNQGDPGALELLPQLEQYPTYTQGWIQLGGTLLQLGQIKAALAVFHRILQREPEHVMALCGVNEVSLRQGNPKAVADRLERASTDRQAHPRLQLQLGRALYMLGRLEESENVLVGVTTRLPDNAEAWFRLGLVRQDLGRHQQAVDCYRSALALQPSLYEAALNLGIALQELKQLDQAMAAYRQAVALSPSCFNRIAQALTSASTGRLWLSLDSLRLALGCPL